MRRAYCQAPDYAGKTFFAQTNSYERGLHPVESQVELWIDRLRPLELLSLDVFDTVVGRRCGTPEALFLWLGNSLKANNLITCSPEVFARARWHAEKTVLGREGGLDSNVSIDDFYAELSLRLGWSGTLSEVIRDRELTLEKELLFATPVGQALIAAATKLEVPIIFVSDTYFRSDFLKQVLSELNLFPEGSRVFASCEYGSSKSSGHLYKRVLDEVEAPAGRIVHVGDNYGSDVRSAKRHGIRTCFLEGRSITRYEALLDSDRWSTGGLSAAMCGASREVRLRSAVPGHLDRIPFYDVVSGVAAPILFAFTLWAVNRAHTLGLNRLYFLSRDGEVLAEIAETIVARLNIPLEVRYLYVSRRSINLASTFEISEHDLEWVFREATGLPVLSVLARLDITVENLTHLGVTQLAGESLREDLILSKEMLNALKKSLLSGRFDSVIKANAQSRRALAIDYLRQEGLIGEGRHGVVDLGGVGSQVRSLYKLTTSIGDSRPLHIFLMGLQRHVSDARAEKSKTEHWLKYTECFIYDRLRGRGAEPFRGLQAAYQIFCTATHETVTEYQRTPDGIVPVFKQASICPSNDWGFDDFRRSVTEFAERLLLDPALCETHAPMHQTVLSLLRSFALNPTRSEAEVWGSVPIEGGGVSGESTKEFARPYTWHELVAQLLMRPRQRKSPFSTSWNHWHDGSVTISGLSIRVTYYSAKAIRKAIRKLKR